MADKISDDEFDRLLAACRESKQSPGRGGDAGFERTPVSYDFKRPQRIKKDQARGLESIHEQFCRLISPTWCRSWKRSAPMARTGIAEGLTPADRYIQGLLSPPRHGAPLAVLGLRSAPGRQLDMGMVALFSIIAGLAALAGFCSFGFGLGTYHFLSAFAL